MSTFWQPIGKLKEKFIEKLCILQKRNLYLNQFSNKKGAIGKPERPKKHPIWAAHPRTHFPLSTPPWGCSTGEGTMRVLWRYCNKRLRSYSTCSRCRVPSMVLWLVVAPGVVTPYTKVGHRRVLKFQDDPYFVRFQGQFLKNYPLFRVKTRTILLSKIPLFLPIQGHFQKIPLFVQKQHRNNTGPSPLQALSIFRTWVLPRLISLETSERLRLFLHFYNTYANLIWYT